MLRKCVTLTDIIVVLKHVTRPLESGIQILMTSLVCPVFSCKQLAPIDRQKFVIRNIGDGFDIFFKT